MIYTVTFNPAIDYVIKVDNLTLGEINRTTREYIFCGGKGINVSHVLANLGMESVGLGFIAGFTGDVIEKGAKELGFAPDFIRVREGMTRINVKVKSNEESEINGMGPVIHDDELQKMYEKLDELQDGDVLILAGSIPATLPSDVYEKIMERLQEKDIRIVVDATKDLLLNVLKYHPFLIKPNNHELGEMFGVVLKTNDEIVEYAKKGLFYEVEIPTVTADNMKSIISTVKGYSNKLTFMSTQYNAMGVPTYTDRSSQIIFIDAEFDAMMDVEVLASAFNMDKAEFMGRRILIDNFGELTGAKLLLCDESFFQIYDVLLQFEDVRNPEGLYWNYFLHKWTVFSVSRFANAILFTVPDNEITGITLNPSNSFIQRSQLPKDVTINATIKSTGTVDDTLEWEMTGNESTETTMTVVNNTQVRVHVSANEKIPNTFNIIAKSKYFPVSQTATISTRENA